MDLLLLTLFPVWKVKHQEQARGRKENHYYENSELLMMG